jgi:hypothetical protein
MILHPGTFTVSDYRKPIPASVKHQVLINAAYLAAAMGKIPENFPTGADDLEFDHRPPLCERPFNIGKYDFVPTQHDPEHIVAISKAWHRFKTFGRKVGALKTVTTSGSDVGERARSKRIQKKQSEHNAKMELKNIVDKSEWPQSMVRSRFQKGKKQWPKRSFARRPKKVRTTR